MRRIGIVALVFNTGLSKATATDVKITDIKVIIFSKQSRKVFSDLFLRSPPIWILPAGAAKTVGQREQRWLISLILARTQPQTDKIDLPSPSTSSNSD
jgi:hypothetical protein